MPLLLLLQHLANRSFDRLFDSNFAIIRMSCFYAACILAFLSITICRFSNQWLVAAIVILAALASQYYLGDRLLYLVGFLNSPLDWYHTTSIFLLAWLSLIHI